MDARYQTVFEISQKSFNWWLVAAGIGFLALGVILIVIAMCWKWPWRRKWVGYFFVAFALLWTLPFSDMYSAYGQFQEAYRTGQYSVVEGVVEDFRPMPWEGHQYECFSVKGVSFCYSDYVSNAGFNNSASHGGPIRASLPVRIGYIGGSIVRIDIQQDQIPTSAERKSTELAAQTRLSQWTQRDPQFDKMNLGFALGVVFMTGWWNVSWERFMKFWVQPPYRRFTVIGFRLFFAANLAGSIAFLVSAILRQTRPLNTYVEAGGFGAAFIVVIILMVHFAEWHRALDDRK